MALTISTEIETKEILSLDMATTLMAAFSDRELQMDFNIGCLFMPRG